MDAKFANAKKVMNFYMTKLEDSDTTESQYALQYAHIQMVRYRLTCVLDALHSYEIDVEHK